MVIDICNIEIRPGNPSFKIPFIHSRITHTHKMEQMIHGKNNAAFAPSHLRDTMLPSSAGRLLILLDDRSKNTRLCSLAISGGMRDRELSLRCRAVRCVSDQRPELRLRTLPET